MLQFLHHLVAGCSVLFTNEYVLFAGHGFVSRCSLFFYVCFAQAVPQLFSAHARNIFCVFVFLSAEKMRSLYE